MESHEAGFPDSPFPKGVVFRDCQLRLLAKMNLGQGRTAPEAWKHDRIEGFLDHGPLNNSTMDCRRAKAFFGYLAVVLGHTAEASRVVDDLRARGSFSNHR